MKVLINRTCLKVMRYENLSDLPEHIKEKLPVEAQKIYMQAFNQCFEEFDKAEPRSHASLTLDEKARRGAWATVELTFQKQKTGNWVKKAEKVYDDERGKK